MYRIRKILITAVLVFIIIGVLGALDFNVSPQENGTLDFLIGHDWDYNFLSGAPSGLYSSIQVDQLSVMSEDDDGSQYVATSGTTFSIGSDIIGYRLRKSRFRVDLAVNILYETMEIREIGYMDLPDPDLYPEFADDVVRHFILNDRNIVLLLPRIKGKMNYKIEDLTLSFGGEYAPWLNVGLSQNLTFLPGENAFYPAILTGLADGESISSNQSANNAFSLNARARYENPFLVPQLSLTYDYLDIKYDMLGLFGEVTIDNLIQTLSLDGMFVLNFMDLEGIKPAITFNYTWDWTTNRTAGESETTLIKDMAFGFGFEF